MARTPEDDQGGQSGAAGTGKTTIIEADGQEIIALPDADFVKNAEILRDGQDLVLTAEDGSVIVIEGYFNASPAPLLQAPNGEALSPQLVESFVKQAGPQQYAAAGAENDESPVGAIHELSGKATITRADGSIEQISIGMPVFEGDIIETEGDGAVNIVFIDETSFAISQNARLAIDEYVFDPASESGKTDISILRGLFVFTSGLIGRDDPDDVNIDTPMGSIGIRGTVIVGNVYTGEVTVMEGAIVMRSFSGVELTLADQYETAVFNPATGEIFYEGKMSPAEFMANFAALQDVAQGMFSAVSSDVQSGEAGEAGENGQTGQTGQSGQSGEPANDGANAQNNDGGDAGTTIEGTADDPAGAQTAESVFADTTFGGDDAGFGEDGNSFGGDDSGVGGNDGGTLAGGDPTASGTGGFDGGTGGAGTTPGDSGSGNENTATGTDDGLPLPPPPDVINPPAPIPGADITSTSFTINENTSSPTAVGTVGWVSLISPMFLETGGSGASLFDIDSAGNITFATGTLDYETTNSYTYDIQATDASGTVITKTLTINVGDLDDNSTTLPTNTGLTLAEGASTTLTSAMLGAADVDTPNSGITFTLGAATANGVSISLNGTALVATGTFTMADVANGLVTIHHDGSEFAGTENITFSVGDGINTPLTGQTFAVTVTAVNDAPTGVPTITGTTQENQTLTADTTSIADADGIGAFSYQWTRNGADISGATAATYTLGDADVGAVIAVRVSYTDGGGTMETLASADTAAVTNINDAPTGTLAITGTAQENQTLTADTSGIADGDGLGTYSYQWTRDGSDITGATAATYTLGDADVGAVIAVRVSYTDGGGTLETLTSADTSAVTSDSTDIDTITGTAGNDILVGDDGNNIYIGLDGDDSITGGAGSDSIDGGAGMDTLTGGAGNDLFIATENDGSDTIDGGGGIDIYDASAVTSAINFDLFAGKITYNSIDDSVTNIEEFIGGSGDDIFISSSAMHTIDGDTGFDTVDYSASAAAVDVNLTTGTGAGGDAAGDTLINIENVIGTAFADTITGNASNNSLTGGLGNDVFNVTDNDGTDILDGGTGNDRYDASTFSGGAGSTNSRIYNLGANNNGTVIDGSDTDSFTSIEEFFGGTGNDIFYISDADAIYSLGSGGGTDTVDFSALTNGITFDTTANSAMINGGATIIMTGMDIIVGGSGADIFVSGNTAGNQTFDGGNGSDTYDGGSMTGNLVYDVFARTIFDGVNTDTLFDIQTVNAGSGADLIDFSGVSGSVDIDLGTGMVNDDGNGNILTNAVSFENITGSNQSDSLSGDTLDNVITGGLGVDFMNGGAGDDTFNLANGDFLATETINGGNDTDRIVLIGATTVDFRTGVIVNIENLEGSNVNDAVTMSAQQLSSFNSINLLGGTDSLTVSVTGNIDISSGSITTVTGVETSNLVGNAGNDTITLTGAQLNAILNGTNKSIDLGGGNDRINLTSTSAMLNVLSDAQFVNTEMVSAVLATAAVTINLAMQTESLTIDGSGFDDTISGGTGNDFLFGQHGDDTIVGGDGTDVIYGGHGLNTMTGGAGSDIFVFENATAFDGDPDIITDYTLYTDFLDLNSILLSAGFIAGVNDIDDYVQFAFNGSDTEVRVDIDGTGIGSAVHIATLQGITSGVDTTNSLFPFSSAITDNLGPDLSTPLVDHWRFDEQSGLIAADSRGAMFINGVLNDAQTSVPGVAGSAFHFDGFNDYVTVSNYAGLNDSFTLSMWVSVDNLAASGTLLSQASGGGVGISFDSSADRFVFNLGASTLQGTTSSVTANQYYNVVATYDDTTDAMKLYVNGALQDSATGVNFIGGAADLFIGSLYGSSGFFAGNIDDVKVFDRALIDASEIDFLYSGVYDSDRNVDNIAANLNDQNLTGTAANNTFFDGGTFDTSFFGGDGDDRFVLSNGNFNKIDGGADSAGDFLDVGGSIDLSSFAPGDITRIEEIKMTGGVQTLTLTKQNLMSILAGSDSGVLTIDSSTHLDDWLRIDNQTIGGEATGTSNTSLIAAAIGGTYSGSSGGFHLFTISGNTLQIDQALIDSGRVDII